MRDLHADLPRRHAAHVHEDSRVLLAEALDERQEHVHASFVRSDEHAPALQVSQLANRELRLLGEALEPFGIAAQHAPRLCEGAVFRRSIEQPLPDFVLEAADGLADRRLGPMELDGGA